jgi:hypothetical protein
MIWPRSNEGVDSMTRIVGRRAAAVCTAVLIVLAAGCGSSGGSSSSDTKLCDSISSLHTSLQDLKKVDLAKNGTSGLQSAIDDVQKNVTATTKAAKSEFGPQVDALETAVKSLGDALRNVVANGVAPVRNGLESVQSAGQKLQQSVQDVKGCT